MDIIISMVGAPHRAVDRPAVVYKTLAALQIYTVPNLGGGGGGGGVHWIGNFLFVVIGHAEDGI